MSITAGAIASDVNATVCQGYVAVDGVGSSWINSGILTVGNNYEYAPLNEVANVEISGGATLTSTSALIYDLYEINGNVNVQGAGSTWTNTGKLNLVGGTLDITGGGYVTCGSLSSLGGTVAINIGSGSMLNLGQSTYTNTGVTSFRAMPQLPSGTYYGNPIAAGAGASSATIQAIGGIWNSANQSFVVTAAANATSGKQLAFSLSQTQRILVTNSLGQSVGASFVPGNSSTVSDMTATALSSSQSQALQNVLPAGESIAAGWGFSASSLYGEPSNSPVYLSMQSAAVTPPMKLSFGIHRARPGIPMTLEIFRTMAAMPILL